MKTRRAGSATAGGRRQSISLLCITLFWCGLTGVFAWFVGRNIYRAWDAWRRYVPVEAVVLLSEVRSGHGSEGGTVHGYGIRYRYRVDGVERESGRYVFGEGMSSGGYRRAAALVRQHPAGSRMTVYVDPRNPAEAVVDRRPDPAMFFLLLFLQPFLMVGLGLLGACIVHPFSRRALRRFVRAPVAFPLRVPTWGVLRLEKDGGRRHVLTPRKGTREVLFALAAGYGGTCFAAIFIVGIFFGGFGQPNLLAVAVAFAAAVAAGVVAAVYAARAARRKPRLVVDAFNRFIALEGPSERAVVPFSAVDSWVVGSTGNPRRLRQEGSPAEVPLLALRRGGGTDMPVHVFAEGEEAGVVAARCAEVLSRLSGHPATGGGDDAARSPAGGGSLVRAALDALREKRARVVRLRDLT